MRRLLRIALILRRGRLSIDLSSRINLILGSKISHDSKFLRFSCADIQIGFYVVESGKKERWMDFFCVCVGVV